MIRDQLQTNEKLTFTLNGVEVKPGQTRPLADATNVHLDAMMQENAEAAKPIPPGQPETSTG